MLILGENSSNLPITICVDDITITSVESVELLGISIDSKLSFQNHISSLCRKAGYRVKCLNRIRTFLNQQQLNLLLNSYILSVFNYAPIIWMFSSKSLNREINTIHKRAIRAVCQDFSSSYEDLLRNHDFIRIHEIHLRAIICEIYKTLHGLNPFFMQRLFHARALRYSLRNQNLLSLPSAKSSHFGTQSFVFRGSLLWNSLPDSVKLQPSLESLKRSLKSLTLAEICGCKICTNWGNPYYILTFQKSTIFCN